MRIQMIVAIPLLIVAAAAFGSTVDDARQLQSEANAILRASNGQVADPKVYADAVRKLEKAQLLLDQAEKEKVPGIESLEQEVGSALFWARRFSNVQVADELHHGKSDPVKPPEPSKPADPNAVEAEYKKTEQFESEHKGDDYAIALRWFQFSSEHSGTDYGLKGLARAREAQSRYTAAQEAKKNASQPQSEDAKLITAGNALYDEKKYDEALAKYNEAKKIADTTLVERRIGHTFVEQGHVIRDDYSTKYRQLQSQFAAAQSRGDRAGMSNLAAQVKALNPLADKALKLYDSAEIAFLKGLELAKGKDLECEGHIAFVMWDRGPSHRVSAKTKLGTFLDKYQAANDEERTILDFAKTLYRMVGGTVKN